MANANTNLLQINLNPTAAPVDSTPRISRKSQLTQKDSGSEKFSTALDKASAKIDTPAQPEKSAAEIQPVQTEPEAKADLTDATVQAPPQGLKESSQDATQDTSAAIIPKIISQPTAEIPAPSLEISTPEIPAQSTVELSAPQIPSQPTLEVTAPEVSTQPTVEVTAQEIPSQPTVEVTAPEVSTQPTLEAYAPEILSQPTVEVTASEIPSQPVSAPEIPTQPREVDDEVPVLPDAAPPVQPVFVGASYFFSANTETLLAPKAEEAPAAVNLQAVLPQSGDSNSQSMLDLLGGKTWSAADVQASVTPQAQPVSGRNSSAAVQTAQALPTVQAQSSPQINQQAAPQVQTPVQTQPAPVIFARFQPQQNFTQTVTQPVENSQPEIQVQPQVQPVQIQPTVEVQAAPQPQVQTQPVEISAAPQVEIQPQAAPVIQPIENSQPEIQVQPQVQTPAAAVAQAVEISAAPQVQATTQPQVQQQAQPISDALGVNVTVEEAPVSTPVIPVQQAPTQQQFSQPQQQQNFTQTPAQTVTQPVAQVSAVEQPAVEPQIQTQPVQVSQAPVQPQISQPVEVPVENYQPPVAQISTVETAAAQPQVQVQPTENLSAEENSAAQVSDSPTPIISASNANNIQQPVAQVQAPDATAQAPREDFNVPAQIVQQARLIRTAENTEMVINLKPEHLGQLTLRISVSQNGAVNASFFSDNAQVRTIIENSLVQLRNELNEQGLKVENVQVYSGLSDGGLTNGQGQQAWQQNQQQPNPSGRINLSALEEEVDALNPADTVSTDGVDYKI